jgi:hypothetical protein
VFGKPTEVVASLAWAGVSTNPARARRSLVDQLGKEEAKKVIDLL